MTLSFDLRINQGETYRLSIPVLDQSGNPVALSGMTARGQIRSYASSTTVLYEWSTVAGNLALNGSDVVITVPAVASSAWVWRTAAYDIELVDGSGNVTRLVEGHVVVQPEVTRP
jgi:hypothetical protein